MSDDEDILETLFYYNERYKYLCKFANSNEILIKETLSLIKAHFAWAKYTLTTLSSLNPPN